MLKPFSIDLKEFDKHYNSFFDMDLIFHIRGLLNKELEVLRIEKLIGSSEDCRVRFHLTREVLELVYPLGIPQLRAIYKVSMVDYVEADECSFEIEPMKDNDWFVKCPRCYLYHSFLSAYENLCDRCCHNLISGYAETNPILVLKVKEYCEKWNLDWTKPLIDGRIMEKKSL